MSQDKQKKNIKKTDNKEVKEVINKEQEYLDGWKRCQADFENYKKMQSQLTMFRKIRKMVVGWWELCTFRNNWKMCSRKMALLKLKLRLGTNLIRRYMKRYRTVVRSQ